MPDFIPPGLFQGVGVLTILTGMLVTSWWMLMRGALHTDREFTSLERRCDRFEALAEKNGAIADEALKQNRDLIETNRTITHALEGFRAAVEDKKP